MMLLHVTAAALLALAEGGVPVSTPCPSAEHEAAVQVPEGTPLYSKPAHSGEPLAIVDADVTLGVRARCGAWVEVVYDGRRAYLIPGDAYVPPLDFAFAVRASVAVTADLHEERLADVRSSMGSRARPVAIGPWKGLTDAPASDVEPLARVATRLPDDFSVRYGLKLRPQSREAVALFATLGEYRAFLEKSGIEGASVRRVGGVDLSPRSHVDSGIAATSLRDGPKLTRIHLVHELTHLLQARAFPAPLPWWLSEGMAEDLAWSRAGEDGRLDLGSVQGLHFMEAGVRIDTDSQGPSAALADYVWALRGGRGKYYVKALPSLDELLADKPEAPEVQRGFVQGLQRRKVTQACLFVRFLLDGARDWKTARPIRDGDQGPRARAFQKFLARVAQGGPSSQAALLDALGIPSKTLSRDFDSWVLTRLAANE